MRILMGLRTLLLAACVAAPMTWACAPTALTAGRPPAPPETASAPTTRPGQTLPTLVLDDRYRRDIRFDDIAVTVELPPNTYYRDDGPVADVVAHQRQLFEELSIHAPVIRYTNAATYGRCFAFTFAGGTRSAFAWVLRRDDPNITAISREHEKFHALANLAPELIPRLDAACRAKGFTLDLAALDEELAASVVEVLSLHLKGVALERIGGSENVVRAVALLTSSRVDAGRPDIGREAGPATRPRDCCPDRPLHGDAGTTTTRPSTSTSRTPTP